MFDIGVNLTSGQLLPDIADVMQRAELAGIRGMAITGTSLSESREAIALCEQYNSCFKGKLCTTAGVHPHEAKEWDAVTAEKIHELADHPWVAAVGETGLDFNRNYSPPEKQIEAFRGQLQIASETGLPLFLHERDAFDQQIELLRQYRDKISDAVAHCFTGTLDQLNAYLELGFYIGVTGWVCDERRGGELAAMVNRIPLDRLLVETDSPWLLPRNIEPKPKSRRNEPAFLGWVIRKLAECYGLEESELAEQTCANAQHFFRLQPG